VTTPVSATLKLTVELFCAYTIRFDAAFDAKYPPTDEVEYIIFIAESVPVEATDNGVEVEDVTVVAFASVIALAVLTIAPLLISKVPAAVRAIVSVAEEPPVIVIPLAKLGFADTSALPLKDTPHKLRAVASVVAVPAFPEVLSDCVEDQVGAPATVAPVRVNV
jgi:hypothetical protein